MKVMQTCCEQTCFVAFGKAREKKTESLESCIFLLANGETKNKERSKKGSEIKLYKSQEKKNS